MKRTLMSLRPDCDDTQISADALTKLFAVLAVLAESVENAMSPTDEQFIFWGMSIDTQPHAAPSLVGAVDLCVESEIPIGTIITSRDEVDRPIKVLTKISSFDLYIFDDTDVKTSSEEIVAELRK